MNLILKRQQNEVIKTIFPYVKNINCSFEYEYHEDFKQEVPVDPATIDPTKELEIKPEVKENEEKKEDPETSPLERPKLIEKDQEQVETQKEVPPDFRELEICEEKIAKEECKCQDFSIGDFVVENVGYHMCFSY
jgi:hypothetical protein